MPTPQSTMPVSARPKPPRKTNGAKIAPTKNAIAAIANPNRSKRRPKTRLVIARRRHDVRRFRRSEGDGDISGYCWSYELRRVGIETGRDVDREHERPQVARAVSRLFQ